MKKITWGDAFSFLGWLAIMCGITVTMIFIFITKPTLRYSIGTDENRKQVSIVREIYWYADDNIILDRSVTYLEEVHLVDSLNKTLKK